jgi:hypothetical protein
MWSFLTGLGCAVLLAGLTLVALDLGTVTMVERSDDLSTLVQGIWSEGSQPFPDPEDVQ